MLSSAVIVFREVFEIVLIVGIVLAATRGIPHRNKAICLGFAGGLAGSGLVAFFTGAISEFAQGLGQEYFNAGILFVAALFIGWTLLWMNSHAREMKNNFMKMGQEVSAGRLPYITLSAVIALAIVREGSEIALFSHGMLATGMAPSSLLAGGLLGFAGGAIIGTLLYLGLITLSTRVFFQFTSWLLVLLVAGMMAQGVGFLSAAGLFESLSRTVWDSSWLLSDEGLVGESLKALLGYTARPTALQLLVYGLSLGTLIALMRRTDGRTAARPPAAAAAACAILCLALFAPGVAQASKKVYTPYVEPGEIELESRTGYDIDDDDDVDGKWVQKVALGYGVNDYWFTELYAEFEKEGEDGSEAEFTAIEWENKFMLTQPGEYWLDVGFLTEFVVNTKSDGGKAEAKLLLAKETGNFFHAANIILEQEIEEDEVNETEAGFAWSTRYRMQPGFEPGFEIYNDFGSLTNSSSYDEQTHRIGPVAYGKIGHFKYDAGVLFGISDAAPDATLKLILEYEF